MSHCETFQFDDLLVSCCTEIIENGYESKLIPEVIKAWICEKIIQSLPQNLLKQLLKALMESRDLEKTMNFSNDVLKDQSDFPVGHNIKMQIFNDEIMKNSYQTRTENNDNLFNPDKSFLDTPEFFCDEILTDKHQVIPLSYQQKPPEVPIRENTKLTEKIQNSSNFIHATKIDQFDQNSSSEDEEIDNLEPSKKPRLTCEFCSQTYAQKDSLRNHYKKHHLEAYTKMIEFNKKHPKPKTQKTKFGKFDDRLQCAKCDCVFKDVSQVYTHQKKYHPGYREMVTSTYGKRVTKTDELGEDGEVNAQTCHSYYLKCQQCTQKFFLQEDLDEHQKKWHLEYYQLRKISLEAKMDKYKCKLCGKVYGRSQTFRRHMMTHTGDYPVHCEHCGQGFSDNYRLKRHMMMHTGEYPVRCDICDKGYRDWGRYMRHCKPNHPEIYNEWLEKKRNAIENDEKITDPNLKYWSNVK